MAETDLGLRERKKRETRRVLTEVATRLFAERGFDEVKVADVASAANVSEKTVFNYFATKEDLVLDGRVEIEQELVEALRRRPPSEPVFETVRRHTLALAERMHALPAERRAAFRKVVQTAPSVHARMRQISLETEERIAALLAEQTGAPAADPTPRVVASVIGVLTRLAYGVAGWPAGRRRSHAETLASIATAFDQFDRGFADYGATLGSR